MKTKIVRRLKMAVTLVLILALEVSVAPFSSLMAQAAPSNAPCSTVKTAVVGAVIGGLFGKLTHHKVVNSAAIGGAVGALACVAINYQSHRTQTAEQVREANPQIQPSPQVTVTNYHMQVQPAQIQAGQSVTVETNVALIGGTQESIQNLGIRYDLIDSNGTVQQSVTKPVAEVQPDGGTYQNTITFTPPTGIPHGRYIVRSDLLVNGQAHSEQQGTYTII